MLKDLENKVSVEAMLRVLRDCRIIKNEQEGNYFKCISEKAAPLIKTELGIDFDPSLSTSTDSGSRGSQILNLDVYTQLSTESQYAIQKECAPELKETTENFIGGGNYIFIIMIALFMFINRKKILKLIA